MFKKALALPARTLVALAVVGLALTSAVAPAMADPGSPAPARPKVPQVAPSPGAPSDGSSTLAAPTGCDLGNLCFWVHINWSDGPGELSGTNDSWFDFAHSTCQTGTWADCASSIYNNGRSCDARVWYLENFSGPHLDIPRGTGISNLTTKPLPAPLVGTWNDNIRSNSWFNCR